VLKKIDDFKLAENKKCCILGIAGSGKLTLCNSLQDELGESKYAVCAPTHQGSLIIGAKTMCNLFNILILI
jgi:ABC-type cobalamin/Fe3+-siderophores transport system ATPase subunit